MGGIKIADVNSEIIIYNTEDGKNYNVTYYALPMVFAVGFRVQSIRVTHFNFRKSVICLTILAIFRYL